MAHDLVFQGCRPVGQVHAGVANAAQQRVGVAEQALEGVHAGLHREVVGLARAFVFAQREAVSERPAPLSGVDQHPAQFGDIEKTQIDALTGQRMYGMRCIADQCQSRRDVLPRVTQAQRKGGAPGAGERPAENRLAGARELLEESVFRQREQCFGVLRVGGPDDGAVVWPVQRQ